MSTPFPAQPHQFHSSRPDYLSKAFIQKRLLLVPRLVCCIVLEMCHMLCYVFLTVVCRRDFTSHRQHIFAWALFVGYFVFWAK